MPEKEIPIIPTDPLLLAAARVNTFDGYRLLTNASGFFFERGERLFLVTSRHVMIDEPSKHFPDRIEIELHTDARNMAVSTGFSMRLYQDGKSVWRQGTDTGGEVDVAVIEIHRDALPTTVVFRAFTPEHLHDMREPVELAPRCWWWVFRWAFMTRCITCPWCAMR